MSFSHDQFNNNNNNNNHLANQQHLNYLLNSSLENVRGKPASYYHYYYKPLPPEPENDMCSELKRQPVGMQLTLK